MTWTVSFNRCCLIIIENAFVDIYIWIAWINWAALAVSIFVFWINWICLKIAIFKCNLINWINKNCPSKSVLYWNSIIAERTIFKYYIYIILRRYVKCSASVTKAIYESGILNYVFIFISIIYRYINSATRRGRVTNWPENAIHNANIYRYFNSMCIYIIIITFFLYLFFVWWKKCWKIIHFFDGSLFWMEKRRVMGMLAY